MKRLIAFGIVVGALAFSVSGASAQTLYASHLYRSTHVSCSSGALDTGGARYGTFGITGDQYRTVSAYVQTDNLAPYRTYWVSIYEYGSSGCVLIQNITSFTTDSGGHGLAHFQFYVHSGERSAFAWIQHGATNDIVESTALPVQ
jgi:hypothetical protein